MCIGIKTKYAFHPHIHYGYKEEEIRVLHGAINWKGKKKKHTHRHTHTQVMIEFMVQFELEIVEACKKKDNNYSRKNSFFWGGGGKVKTFSRSRSWVKISNLFLAPFHPINRKDIRKKKIIATGLSQVSDGSVRSLSPTDWEPENSDNYLSFSTLHFRKVRWKEKI